MWCTQASPLTARCHPQLRWFESRHERKLPVSCESTVVSTGHSAFPYHLPLVSNDFASEWRKKWPQVKFMYVFMYLRGNMIWLSVLLDLINIWGRISWSIGLETYSTVQYSTSITRIGTEPQVLQPPPPPPPHSVWVLNTPNIYQEGTGQALVGRICQSFQEGGLKVDTWTTRLGP